MATITAEQYLMILATARRLACIETEEMQVLSKKYFKIAEDMYKLLSWNEKQKLPKND